MKWYELVDENWKINWPTIGLISVAAVSAAALYNLPSAHREVPVDDAFCTGGAPSGGGGIQIINTDDLSSFVYVPQAEVRQGQDSLYGDARWGQNILNDDGSVALLANDFTGASLNFYYEESTCLLAEPAMDMFLHYQFIEAKALHEQAEALRQEPGGEGLTRPEAVKRVLRDMQFGLK